MQASSWNSLKVVKDFLLLQHSNEKVLYQYGWVRQKLPEGCSDT